MLSINSLVLCFRNSRPVSSLRSVCLCLSVSPLSSAVSSAGVIESAARSRGATRRVDGFAGINPRTPQYLVLLGSWFEPCSGELYF